MSALVLVPSPLRAARAARRLCDAQGGVLFGPVVDTLDRTAASILAEAADRRAVLPPLAERLLALEAGRDAGPPLADLAPASGLAAALVRAIAELRLGEVSAAEVATIARELEGAPAQRLGLVARALGAYEARLAQVGALDAAAALREAAAAVRRGVLPPGTGRLDLLVLDGFTALPPAGLELVAALTAHSARARIHVPWFPERPDLSAPAEPLLRRIEALHEAVSSCDVEVVLPRVDSVDRAGLPAALLIAFAGGGPIAGQGGRVLAASGAGEDGEARVAARIAARFAAEGIEPGEMAVIAPAPARAAGRLSQAFAEAGVPFAAGRGPALADAPLVRAVREVLAAATGGLSRRAAERLAVSSYLGLAAAAGLPRLLGRAGALEGRVLPAEALRRRAAALSAPAAARERAALLRAAQELEALDARLRPLGSAGTAREHAARLGAFLDAAGVRRRAARGDRAVARRDLGALARLEEVADGLARALALVGRGEERMPAGHWGELLESAIAGAALPPDLEPAAGGVELAGLDEAPGVSVRAAILVGCAREAWPAPPPPEPLLRDPERIAVNRALRRAALATTATRRARALHQAFCAAAAGREAVALLWPGPGPAGGGGAPAPVAVEALSAIGIPVPVVAPAEPGLAAARSAREALRAAARLARSGDGEFALGALGPAGLSARGGSVIARGAVEVARVEAVGSRVASPFSGGVTGSAALTLRAALPAEWAPTALEEFARCPFKLFLRLACRIPDAEGADLDLDGRDEGSLLHAVLERFVAGRVERRAWPPCGCEEDLAEARAVAGEVFARFERQGRVGDPAVWAARREVILARTERFVRTEAAATDELVPALVEHRFGGSGRTPPLALEWDGERVLMKGRIDRVDASPQRLRVIDYKNSGARGEHGEKLAPGAIGETSFQMPIYLLAAARDLPGRVQLEGTFALLRTGDRVQPLVLDAGAPLAAGRPGVERPFAAVVAGMVRRIRAGDFPVASRGCEHCPHGAICRFQGEAAREDAA